MTIRKDLPASARPMFEQLLHEPRRSEAALREDVDRYLALVRRAAAQGKDVDVDLAEVLGARLRFLISDSTEQPDTFALVQATTRYFVVRHDAEDDLASDDGFADDTAVFNALAAHIERPDLAI